ncbi:MAG TPA: peptidylprolyl isomerase [Herpetosiphonaceae bacterium]
MVLRRLWLALAAVALLSGCASTRPPVNAANPTAGPDDAVARITFRDNSVLYISQATLDQFSNEVYADQQGPAPAEPVLNQLLSRQLLLRLARNTDVVADPQDLQSALANLRTQLCDPRVAQMIEQEGAAIDTNNSDQVWDACAQTIGFANGSEFRSFISEELTIQEVRGNAAPKDQIHAAHILFDPGNYEGAANAYQQLQSGADFTELAKTLSIEPAAAQSGGDLPPFNEEGLTSDGQPFDTTFVSKTFELKQQFLETGAAIGEPFETQFGWHIVKVIEMAASPQAQQTFQDDLLERARDAQVTELQQPETNPAVPLLGVIEILKPLPTPQAVPTIEPVPLPEESPTPEATSVLEQSTVTPEETTTP